jgi:radical SAM superfamily enzyme YgiQ (UPF0313 family)
MYNSLISIKTGNKNLLVPADRLAFSCFFFSAMPESSSSFLKDFFNKLIAEEETVIVGSSDSINSLMIQIGIRDFPKDRVRQYENKYSLEQGAALFSVLNIDFNFGDKIKKIFVCDKFRLPFDEIKQKFSSRYEISSIQEFVMLRPDIFPAESWVPIERNIYPLKMPPINVEQDLDILIVDCPSRNLSLMPNGLGYVNNALKLTNCKFQILDLDIIAYHRFHIHRLFDMGGVITLPNGRDLPEDPWQAEHYDLWSNGGGGVSKLTGKNYMVDFFSPLIDEVVSEIIASRPKAVGFSIQGCNEAFSEEVAKRIKEIDKEILIVVGGFSCYNPDVGRKAFPLSDYMCIGEADLTVGPLVESLAKGLLPKNLPGVLSRFDTPDYEYIPAPMIHDLDKIEFPKYEWIDLSIYRNFNDYQLTPIIASRGCRWSRCTFCAERFYWRIRTPINFVDELEWLVSQGCYLFMFNESDLGGMPERVVEICDEIIRRGLHKKIKLTGQLRVNKLQNRTFFEKLREANFVALRFGIDAFSENTLKLQKKGYTVDMISQNLKDCWEVGIYTEVNWVIGVPGETERDVDEGIELILKNREYIGRLANINPLILVNGGVYWIDPDSHNIKFREPKEALYEKFPRAMPADVWFSVEPYIDAAVRKLRFEKIVLALHDAGFEVGAWAARIIEDVKLARDKARSGSKEGDDENVSYGEFTVLSDTNKKDSDDFDNKENKKIGKKIITIKTENDISSSMDKKLATPPLFNELILLKKMKVGGSTYQIVNADGWIYAVPEALIEANNFLNASLLSSPGVIKGMTESEVREILEENIGWANSRGQYDDRNNQKEGGAYLRANSLNTQILNKAAVNFSRYVSIEYFEGYYYGLMRTNDHKRKLNTSLLEDLKLVYKVFFSSSKDLSLEERLKSSIPENFLNKFKQIIFQFTSQDQIESIKKLKGNKKIFALLTRYIVGVFKATIQDFAVKDLSFRNALINTDKKILGVVTYGAQPELLWTSGNKNIIKFDGLYYKVPHGMPVNWQNPTDLMELEKFNNLKMLSMEEDASKPLSSSLKNILETKNIGSKVLTVTNKPLVAMDLPKAEYVIVEYEGWAYGIPYKYRNVNLEEVDIMEYEGVIRDVEKMVVEDEINSLSI